MCPNSIPKRQQGSALVVAIFVITSLAVLVGFLSQFLRTSSDSVVVEVFGSRAFMAAQTGLQQAMVEIFPPGGEMQTCAEVTETTVSYNIAGLQQCTSEVTCSDYEYSPDDMHYRLQALGQCNAGDITTSRRLVIETRVFE